MTKEDLLVIIPAYNEEDSIAKTVKVLKKTEPKIDYIVVNDGSSDETLAVCKANGINVLDLPVNVGLAGAVQAGYRYALKHGYNIALQYDGDGQHRPEFIEPMLAEIKNGADIVIGSRFVTKKKPMSARMFGSRLISFTILIFARKRIKDPTSGMRMVCGGALKDFGISMNRAPEPDTISFKIREGYKVVEVQADMNEREMGASYLTLFRSVKYMMTQVISIMIIQPFRKKSPKGGKK